MPTYLRLATVLFTFSTALSAQLTYPSLVAVHAPDGATLAQLVALDLDIAPCTPTIGEVEVILHTPTQWQTLSSSGLNFSVVYEDLMAHLQAGLIPEVSDSFPAFGTGSMGGWFTWAESIAAFDCLQAAYPSLMTQKVSIGLSHEGRNLWMYKISDNVLVDEGEAEIYIDCVHHAREPGTVHSLLYFVQTVLQNYGTDAEQTALLDNREIYFVPFVNPDGYVHNQTTNPNGGGMWRKNRRLNAPGVYGVDLNRNYPYFWGYMNQGSSSSTSSDTYRGPSAASEPETQAILAFAATRSFTVAQSAHTYSGFHLYPFSYIGGTSSPMQAAYLEWGARLNAKNGYRVGTTPQLLYTATGSSTDWWEGQMGAAAYTTEMGSITDFFWPPTSRIVPIAIDNFPSFYDLAWIGGSDVRFKSQSLQEVSGDGDPFPEPSEVFDLLVTVRNGGRLPTQSGITATLSALTPYATVLMGSAGSGSALSSLTDLSLTFRFSIAANAPTAAPLDFALITTFDGISRAETLRLTGGAPIIAVSHDFEASASGWTVGSPLDQGTGSFVRADPVGTTSPVNPWQPEDDHTPGAGTQCFVTANGNDVDGITTLNSPVFDLTNLLAPTVRFWLWFVNDDQDDEVAFEISNDGGLTFISAGYVRGIRNTWTEHRIRIQDFLLPTNQVMLRFRVADLPDNSSTECALDDFSIEGYPANLNLNVSALGGPGGLTDLLLASATLANVTYVTSLSTTAQSGLPLGDGRVAGIDDGPLLTLPFLVPTIFENWIGNLSPTGTANPRLYVPNDPALSGFTFYVAAVSVDPLPTPHFVEITGTRRITIP